MCNRLEYSKPREVPVFNFLHTLIISSLASTRLLLWILTNFKKCCRPTCLIDKYIIGYRTHFHGALFICSYWSKEKVFVTSAECHLQFQWIITRPWLLQCRRTNTKLPGQARLRSGCWSAYYSAMERLGRPAWLSATQQMAIQRNTSPLRLMTFQVSQFKLLFFGTILGQK